MKSHAPAIDISQETGLSCIRYKLRPEEPLTPPRFYVGSYGRHLTVSSHLPCIIPRRRIRTFGKVPAHRAHLRTDSAVSIMLLFLVKQNQFFLAEGRYRVSEAELSPLVGVGSRNVIAPSCCSPPQLAGTGDEGTGLIYESVPPAGSRRRFPHASRKSTHRW